MTTHIAKRCQHCRCLYSYQGSGHGCNQPQNDSRYCPDCKTAVLTALEAVPVRFERVWEPTSDYTVPQLLQIQAEEAAVAAERAFTNRFAIVARRVSTPLFNLDTGEASCGGFLRVNGRHYHYEYWSGREAEGTVRVEMEKDLETGTLVPWREVPHDAS